MSTQVPPWEPQGRALLDHHRGTPMGLIHVLVEGGEVEDVDPAHFFRGPDEFADWERAAVDAARGTVLDLGAGAGCHALALAARGLEVLPFDVDLRCVAVMKQRGLPDARLGSLGAAGDGACDTLLQLMHGVGLAADPDGLDWLADEAARVVRPGGQWLLDGRGPGDDAPWAVSRQRLEYDGFVGAPYDWLWPTADFVTRRLERASWRCAPLAEPADGRWLLRAER